MTAITPSLHQFGANEISQLPQMNLIIDMGGIINKITCQTIHDGTIDDFKEFLNTPVLSFEIDEVDDAPFRNYRNKMANMINIAHTGSIFIKSGLQVGTLCLAGQNRSGLMSALILLFLGFSPEEAIELIQTRRMNALNNERIVEFIMGIYDYFKIE